MNRKVVIGMSGGVDSSIAAFLLKQDGYDVIGATLRLGDTAAADSAIADARRVAESLSIPHHVFDFKSEFELGVMDYFVREYLRGRTPNPCIVCNRLIKWEALLAAARGLGADYIATGHYAHIAALPNGRLALAMAKTAEKDQSYALYKLTQDQLRHTIMPLGDYTKGEVRRMAADIGLTVANKPDSQEICFIEDDDYGRFIRERLNREVSLKNELPLGLSSGNFISASGAVIGEHKGIAYYTVGQRKGLGVTFGKPMYVKELRPAKNEIVLAQDAELYEHTLSVYDVNFMGAEAADFANGLEVTAKIRYNQKKAPAFVKLNANGGLDCHFSKAQRAITPGQAAVFYDGDYILAGGSIR